MQARSKAEADKDLMESRARAAAVHHVRIARTASTRISECEDASRRRCRPYDIGRIHVHCSPLPLDNQGDKAPGAGEAGHKIQADRLAGDSRRVTPLACIHRPVKPLDGRMVGQPLPPAVHHMKNFWQRQ